jgi:hypothetical protein
MLLDLRLKRCLALLTLISFVSTAAFAQETTQTDHGKFAQVKEGHLVPFDGWCFDTRATARLQANLEFAKQRCEIEIKRKLQGAQAAFDMQISNLKLRVDTIQTENDAIIKIKNKEIEDLEAAALKRPNDYTYLWALGGFTVGISVTLVTIVAMGASL